MYRKSKTTPSKPKRTRNAKSQTASRFSIDSLDVTLWQPAINRSLLSWFKKNQRDLPWRRLRTPYTVWISEAMLQQTRVAAVVPYFERWINRFPDIATLAQAGEQEALKAWEGLGYYSRVRNLHRAAQIIVNNLSGQLPSQEEELRKLPGFGKYTAAAVASFAFQQPSLVVDGNVARVLSRWFRVAISYTEPSAPDFYRELYAKVAAGEKKRLPLWNEAIMELGALVCTPRAPDCIRCPMKKICQSYCENVVEQFPPARVKAAIPHYRIATGLLLEKNRLLMGLRKRDGFLGGLWELPGGKCEAGESPEAAVVREYFEETGIAVEVMESLPIVKHGFTHFKITMYPFALRRVGGVEQAHSAERLEWVTKKQIAQLPLPKATKDVLRAIGWENAAV